MSWLLRLEHKPKIYSNAFRIRIFLFRSFSFRIDTINTLIRSRSSLENHTRFQRKIYTCFRTEKVHKPYPLGRHIPIWLFHLPPPPRVLSKILFFCIVHLFGKKPPTWNTTERSLWSVANFVNNQIYNFLSILLLKLWCHCQNTYVT